MHQVVVIHGGRTFRTYDEYILSLKNRELEKERFLVQQDWKDSLPEKLGSEFEIFAPKMPNGQNAQYEEWKIWFGRACGFLNDDVILIGHSLGGIFLAKYLSENIFPKKIRAVILISAPFAECVHEELGSFTLPESLEKFSAQVPQIHLIHSKDDSVVPFEEADAYKKALPNAEMMVFEDRQHFNQESFPELVQLIKQISK